MTTSLPWLRAFSWLSWLPLRRQFGAWQITAPLGLLVLSFITVSMRQAGEPGEAQVAAELRRQVVADSIAGGSTAALVGAFYAPVAYRPVWTRPGGLTSEAQAGLHLLTAAARYGLRPADYEVARLQSLRDSLALVPVSVATPLRANVEKRLTAALLQFVRHLRHGRLTAAALRPPAQPDSLPLDAVAHLHRAQRSGQFAEQLVAAQPTSRSYGQLLRAWQHLLQTNPLAAAQMALPVALNLERLRWEPRPDSLVVVVNIPAYTLQVVRGARTVATHRVVVGKAATPTPEVYSRITYFQAAPEWRVPHSIAATEMLRRLQRDPGSLTDRGFSLYTPTGQRVNPYRVAWDQVAPDAFPYLIRQAPADDNALGNVVFRFANPYAVYLHDTPAKAAFRASTRAQSHGCIRVEHPLALARLLLRRDGAAAPNRLQDLERHVSSHRTKSFGLSAPVPLVVRYLTCDADGGHLRLLPDIYGRDQVLAQAWQQELPAQSERILALR